MVSGATSWKARTNRVIRASSSSLSQWATSARASAIDAGIAGQRRRGQLGQQLVVARRQVAADLAERVVDDVEVVDQPFGVDAGQAAAVPQGDELAVDLDEDPLVLDEPAEQRAAGASGRRQDAGRRQPGRVALQPLQAQALGADRALAPGVDQHDRRRLDLRTRRDGQLDGRRIHARWSLVISSWSFVGSSLFDAGLGHRMRSPWTDGRGVKLGPSARNDQRRMTNDELESTDHLE